MSIALNSGLELTIEKHSHPKKARIIVKENGEELACRIETLKELKRVAEVGKGHFFKGRLQLDKTSSGVEVFVKDAFVGQVSADDFSNLLESVGG